MINVLVVCFNNNNNKTSFTDNCNLHTIVEFSDKKELLYTVFIKEEFLICVENIYSTK